MERPERRFWFRLALALGCTVAELQDRMSSAEFAEWMAFYGVEPFGEVRGDIQAAVIASTVANVNRDPKRRSKPFGLDLFMPLAKGWQKLTGQDTGPEGGEQMPAHKKTELYSRLRSWAKGLRPQTPGHDSEGDDDNPQ